MPIALPNYRVLKRTIRIVVAMLILLTIGFSAWKSVTEYHLTVRAAELQSRGYARALREHAERAFGEADTVLLDTIDRIRAHGGVDKENNRHFRELINRHPRNAPQIASVFLVNRDGVIFASSLDSPAKQVNAADRDYYQHHLNHPNDDTPFLSRPFKSRFSGKWRFTLSRPVRSAAGAFEGLVGVAFELEYFRNFYGSLDLGKQGRIVIVRKDGALLLTEPFKDSDFAKDFSQSHLFRLHLPKASKGTFHIKSGKALLAPDARIISYESLDHYPVVANANFGLDEVTAQWRRNTLIQAVLTLMVSLALLLLALVLLRQLKRIEESYRIQMEHQIEIKRAEERYRLLVDNLPVITWQSNEHWQTSFISSNVERFYGYTPQEIYAAGDQLWLDRIHNEDRERVVASYNALFSGLGVYDVEYRIQRKDGEWAWIHDFAYATAVQDGVRVAHGVFNDITAHKMAEDERGKLEMQLRQAQKMEAIGHLAGGIAHDFNNLLTPILGYAEMAAVSIPDGSPLTTKLNGIISAANKAKELTRQLLGFGRRKSVVTEVIDLNDVILSFNIILRRTIRESIRIELILDPEGSFVKGDRSQIEQIILNMTVNAQDAFDGTHGRINIETCNVRMDGENSRLHPGMLPGEYVLMSFRDNGCGMSPEIINHIFEPFFTTKQVGHGTGLGLATVYGIVRQHDAHISVTSHAGEGSTFNIYFPACAQLPLTVPQVAQTLQKKAAGEITILVVEDNEMVRDLVQEMLTGHGYTVLAAADPHQAIGLLAESDARIELLISDIVMPGMNGPELYEQLVVLRPSLRVVFISGYPINPSLRGEALEANVNYLQKPFTADALLERVHLVL